MMGSCCQCPFRSVLFARKELPISCDKRVVKSNKQKKQAGAGLLWGQRTILKRYPVKTIPAPTIPK